MKQVLLAGIMLALASLACGGAGELDVTPTAEATVAPDRSTAVMTATPLPAATATAVESPSPAATVESVPTDTAPAPARARAADNANLRAGPGTGFEVVGSVVAADPLDVVATNEAGDWYLLASGAWIAAFLVDDAPAGLAVAETIPVVASPTVVIEPTTAPADPTSTPAPQAAIGGQVRITGMLRDMAGL